MNHHSIIRDLIAEVRRLRSELEQSNDAMEELDYDYSNSLARANAAARKAEDSRREAEQEAETARYNASRLAEIQSGIERAARYGEEYKIERLRREARYYS